MTRSLLLIIGTVVLLLGAGTSFAGSPHGSRHERIHQLIVARLASGLELDQAKAQQLGEILKKHRKRKRQMRHEIRQLTAELRTTTAGGNEKEIRKILQELRKTKDSLDSLDEELFDEARALLSPQQLAQFVLIMDEIRSEVRAVRRKRRRPVAPEGSGGPGRDQFRRGFNPGYAQPPIGDPNNTL